MSFCYLLPPLEILVAFEKLPPLEAWVEKLPPLEIPVGIQDCRKIIDHFRGNFRIFPKFIRVNWRMSTSNRLDL